MSTLLGDEYREEQAALMADPVVRAMAVSLRPSDIAAEFHFDSDTPRFGFMMASNAEYRSRGGQHSRSIGGVAHALAAIVRERGR